MTRTERTRPTGRARTAAAIVAVLAVAASCSSDGSEGADGASTTAAADASTTSTTATPAVGSEDTVPGDEWVVSTPEDEGMDAEVLEAARTYAFAEGRNTQSVVVVRHGVIVAEWYADGADADSWVASWSVGKSFASAAIGLAIEQGKIPSVDEPMTTWYPEWEGTPNESMTLKDVLQMQSGLDWNESYAPGEVMESDVIQQVVGEGDQLDYAVGQPSRHEPGTEWNYSSGDAMLLSGVLEQATGMSAGEYAEAELLEPIGIEGAEWWQDTSGHTLTYCCFDATSRDFARFGLLYARGGDWGGTPVVDAGWVADSLVGSEASDGQYGYQWWLGEEADGPVPEDQFAANGHDGQFIHVIPSLDLVVVRNGTYVKDPGEPVADPNLFTRYPPDGLVEGKGTLPPDSWSMDEFLGPIVESVTDD